MSKPQAVKYKKGKYTFEILTKPGSVKKYLAGQLGWDNVLAVEAVFTSSSKKNLAKASDLKAVFGTDNVDTCAQAIIKQGNAQERKEDMLKHKNQLLEYLHSTYLDQQDLPHPLTRLEVAISEAKIRIDISIPIPKLAEQVVEKMQGKLVFKKGTMDYTLTVKKEFAKACASIVNRYSPVKKEIRSATEVLWKISIGSKSLIPMTEELNKISSGDFSLEIGHNNPGQTHVQNQVQNQVQSRPKKAAILIDQILTDRLENKNN